MNRLARKVLVVSMVAVGVLSTELIIRAVSADDPIGLFVTDAHARVGRPATPVSYAGVARRTARRTVYRTSVYVATLPHGCVTTTIEGVVIQQCGSTYYQASGNQYVVVNIN
jgi:hypothetical protein